MRQVSLPHKDLEISNILYQVLFDNEQGIRTFLVNRNTITVFTHFNTPGTCLVNGLHHHSKPWIYDSTHHISMSKQYPVST